MSRKEQLDELLREKLAYAISSEISLENGLITVSYVDCAPDLSSAKVGVSVIPDNKTGSALRALKNKTSHIANELKKKGNFRKIPKIKWIFDPTEKEAVKIEKLFDETEKEDK